MSRFPRSLSGILICALVFTSFGGVASANSPTSWQATAQQEQPTPDPNAPNENGTQPEATNKVYIPFVAQMPSPTPTFIATSPSGGTNVPIAQTETPMPEETATPVETPVATETSDFEPLPDLGAEEAPPGETFNGDQANMRSEWQTQHPNDLPYVIQARNAAASRARVAANLFWVDAAAAAGGNGSEAQPFQRIQEGINAAASGDEVIIRDGTYSEQVVMKPGIALYGQNGWPFVTITSAESPVVTCADNAILADVTIKPTSPTDHVGIMCDGGAPVIDTVLIEREDGVAGVPIALSNTTDAIIYNVGAFGYFNLDNPTLNRILIDCGSVSILNSFLDPIVIWGDRCPSPQPVFAYLEGNSLGTGAMFLATTSQAVPPAVELYNNYIYNNGLEFNASVDSWRTGAIVANNTILGGGRGIFLNNGGWEIEASNNIIGYFQTALVDYASAGSFTKIHNNLFWNNGGGSMACAIHWA